MVFGSGQNHHHVGWKKNSNRINSVRIPARGQERERSNLSEGAHVDGDGKAGRERGTSDFLASTGNPNSSFGNGGETGENHGDSSGFVFGKNPFISDDALNGAGSKKRGEVFSKKTTRSTKKDIHGNKHGKGKFEGNKTDWGQRGIHINGPYTTNSRSDFDALSPNENRNSPTLKARYFGPLFSDMEKSMQGKQHKGVTKKGVEGGHNEWSGLSWKRKAMEEVEQAEQQDYPMKKREISGEILEEEPNSRGKVMEMEEKNQSRSGVAEAVEQPRRPQ
jgi:hypothetical protein